MKRLIAVLIVLTFGGCARLGYYAHLGKGALALAGNGQRVEKILADSTAPELLTDRLRVAESMLEFGRRHLALPVGKKYGKYADLERDYVVWTVVAAPEFGLEPVRWCFPIAGCVAYRGFFERERASRFAQRLEGRGLEVSIGGVKAFSSLGWLNDPLSSTFLFDRERDLAALLFHELAHGLVYAKGDTAFNESFATAVEREAVRRWLARAPQSSDVEAAGDDYDRALEASDRTYAAVASKREAFEELYRDAVATPTSASKSSSAEAPPRAELLRRKQELFRDLRNELDAVDPHRESALAGWIDRDLNNADLASIGLYREHLEAFEGLLEVVDGDLNRFYAAASCLASLEPDKRDRTLAERNWSVCILQPAVRSR